MEPNSAPGNLDPRPVIDALQKEFGNTLAAVPLLQVEFDKLKTAVSEQNDSYVREIKKRDTIIDELVLRIQRGELRAQGDTDLDQPGFRMGRDGRIYSRVSKGLADFAMSVFSGKKVRDMSETVGADGGFMVSPEYIWQLQQLLLNYGVLRQDAMVAPLKSNQAIFPNLVSGMTVYWVTEGSAATTAQPVFSQVSVTVSTLIGLVPISSQLLEDSNIDLGQLLVDLFARAMAKEEDQQGFNGTGAGNDPFVGILAAPAGTNIVQMSTGNTAFTQVTADNLLAMQTATPAPALPGAKYYVHRSIFDVIRTLKTTTGAYIYSPPIESGVQQDGGRFGYNGTVWGYPVQLVEVLPATGATGLNKAFVAFGNLQHIILGDRHAAEVARSDQFAFNKLQTFIRMHERVGIKNLRTDAFTILKTAAS